MLTSEFDFELDSKMIAKKPASPRDHCKLLVYQNIDNAIQDMHFYDIVSFFEAGDVLILNNTKVLRSFIKLKANISINLNKKLQNQTSEEPEWLAFCKNSKKVKAGDSFDFDNHKIIVLQKLDNGEIIIKFELQQITFDEFLEGYAQMPIPQYIEKARSQANKTNSENHASCHVSYEEIDNNEYQTVYSQTLGSIAAPTAGLHFTDELLQRLISKGVIIQYITLHVGAGTFKPITAANIEDHVMHSESVTVGSDVVQNILNAQKGGKKVIAAGTTSMRAIESCFNLMLNKGDSGLDLNSFDTNIFIKPGYKFLAINHLITNFHLPKSSLLVLVSAFIGLDATKQIYQHAIKNNYRFYSYGDACFLKLAHYNPK